MGAGGRCGVGGLVVVGTWASGIRDWEATGGGRPTSLGDLVGVSGAVQSRIVDGVAASGGQLRGLCPPCW